ncbi:MAG: cytochrome c biogenesis heme-transporting ATPase CcmA [Pseudomonadota bacterium]
MRQARSLYCERDDRVLFEALNFELREGQVVQVKGNNGTGKTTLLRMLCGLNDSYEGEIEWYGRPIKHQREEFASALLYIGHRAGVSKVLTPLENLRWSCGIQRTVSDEQIMHALRAVGLRGFEESQCYTLSAGQQQRVSLARLLICQSKLWVLDEPFTTLDVDGVALLEQLIVAHAEAGGSVLVTTHHPLAIAGLQTLVLGNRSSSPDATVS